MELGSLAIGSSTFLWVVMLCLSADAAQPLTGTGSFEQNSDAELRVELVIELSAQRIALLKQYGAVRVNVPRHLFDRVDSILFQHSGSESDQPITATAETQLIGRAIVGDIDSSLLEYVKYRPVRMMVYHSGYDSVLIRLKPGKFPLFPDPIKEDSLPTDSPMVWVNLKNGRQVPGKLRDQAELRFKSQVGENIIPFGSFAGIGIRDESRDSLMWLKNGDRLKGELLFDNFRLLTRSGERTFQVGEVRSITIEKESIDPPNSDSKAANEHRSEETKRNE